MNRQLCILFFMIFGIAGHTNAETEDKSQTPEEKVAAEKVAAEKVAAVKEIERATMLQKFEFGVGLGFENYKDGYVNEAETIGTSRVVRITDSQRQKPSIWLETHYTWDGWAQSKCFTHSAPGFYLGIRALGPNSDTFDAFSLGLLWAFKRTALSEKAPAGEVAKSINIGFGPVWHRTKTLANGISEGQPLPSQYQDIKFDKRDEVSWMLMISTGF